jgi:catechol 2,3-dioxygenase-like lactoylglutathione lyase family enzyme
MHLRFGATLLALGAVALAGSAFAQAPAQPVAAAAVQPAAPVFTLDAMNVFRRFEPQHTAKMVEFYHKVLDLKPLTPVQLDETQQIILFGIGKGQIKLAAGLKEGRQHHLGEINGATGIRLFALTYADGAALEARFRSAGFTAPTFKDIGGGKRSALLKDPAGFWIRLIVDPATTAATGVNVGINVSNLERSRAFYREFVGLEELPPVQDPVLGTTKYPFRHGETTISLWSAGSGLPADTGSAGIQYVISNVDAVNARGLAQNITVEEPLGGLPNFGVRFVWLNDPDGATNYFAQVGAPSAQANAN